MTARCLALFSAAGLMLAAGFGACGDGAPAPSSGGTGNGGADAADVLVWGGSGGYKGGSGGAGGALDSGGAAGAGGDPALPPEHAWLADPEIWKAVPGTEFTHPYCRVFEAASDKLAFPPLAWEGCGDGCAVADLIQGYGTGAWYGVASTHRVSGSTVALLTIEHGVKGTDSYSIRRVVSLNVSGKTAAAIQRRISDTKKSSCIFGNGRESARANAFAGGSPARSVPVTAPVSGGAWVWALPARLKSELPAGLVAWDIDALGGAVFETGKGGVWAMLDVWKNDWTTLEVPSKSRSGSGEGDLAAWVDFPTAATERLRGWTPDGKGVRTLIDPVPFETCDIAMTATSIVGHAMAGNGGCDTITGAPKSWFWTAPRVYGEAGVKPAEGPMFPGYPFGRTGSFIRAWGDHAAVQLGENPSAGVTSNVSVFVMRLSTQKLWRVDARPGFALHSDGWTLTEDHLYVTEKEATNADPSIAKRVVRLDLAKLDVLAKPLN